ncbi:MAG: FHA domain-containing protein [Deltaproteobacteria bacterium]|nr:FHA domain-containing protein [Deltaproteobacteria bacterium]
MIKIYIMNGPEKGKAFECESDTISIGRVKENDLQLLEKSISRKHIRIRRMDSKYFVEDLGSKNGTYVNGHLISSGIEIEVEKGTPITIGRRILAIEQPCLENAIITEGSDSKYYEYFEATQAITLKSRPKTPLKNMEFVVNVSNVLMQSFDISEILQKILDYIFELLKRINRGVIILMDDETGKVLDVISRSVDAGDGDEKAYSESIVNKVLKHGNPIVVLDTLEQGDVDVSESMELMKVRSVMCVPLISRSKIRGVVYVASLKNPHGFRKEDLSLLTTLSGPAAIAIENALLYTDLEKKIKKRTNNLRLAEKKLRESETRFKAMFNSMSSGVTVYDAINDGEDFIILSINTANRNIETLEEENIIGKRVSRVFPEVRDTGLLDIYKGVWKTGRPEHTTISLRRGEDKYWREYFVYRLPSKEIVAIFDDLTDKKRSEDKQKALQEQLYAVQKMELVGTFAQGTAHNFRNILQAISGNVEFLEQIYSKNLEVSKIVNNVFSSVEKGVDLINNLLHFSKMGSEIRFEKVDLTEIILKTYQMIEKVFKQSIEIKIDLQEGIFINGDRSLLSQAFMNLFTNARDAMPKGGELLIKAEKVNNKAMVSVSDTGHGIDKVTQKKIFAPFFTLKEVGKGTGLGLSTTLGIIEQHEGTISVSSELEKGAKFTITLPAVTVDKIQESETQQSIVSGKREKVLVIEDERTIHEPITKLAMSLGYNTITINRPLDAVENYHRWSPDIVLFDMIISEPDAVTCLKMIYGLDPKARIIVSRKMESGVNGIDEDVRGMIKGYLNRPFSLGDLSRTIAQVMEGEGK